MNIKIKLIFFSVIFIASRFLPICFIFLIKQSKLGQAASLEMNKGKDVTVGFNGGNEIR